MSTWVTSCAPPAPPSVCAPRIEWEQLRAEVEQLEAALKKRRYQASHAAAPSPMGLAGRTFAHTSDSRAEVASDEESERAEFGAVGSVPHVEEAHREEIDMHHMMLEEDHVAEEGEEQEEEEEDEVEDVEEEEDDDDDDLIDFM